MEILSLELIGAVAWRNYWTVAAFALACVELFENFIPEVRYIWRQPITCAKVVYVFTRYIGLLGQAANLYFTVNILTPARLSSSPNLCHTWYIHHMVFSWLLFLGANVVIVLRVAALYSCHRFVCAILAFILVAESAVTLISGHRTMKLVGFNPVCEVHYTPIEVVYFCAGVILSQIAMWLMTLFKREVRMGLISPLLNVVVRDGAWVFVIFISMYTIIAPYSLTGHIVKPEVLFAWPTTIICILTCRLILNMHRVYFESHHMLESVDFSGDWSLHNETASPSLNTLIIDP